MIDENVFMNRVLELIDRSKTQRDGIGIKLVDEFNLPGKHSVTRLVDRLLGMSISAMLKLRFKYPDNWKSMVPKIALVETTSLADRVEQLRAGGFTFKDAKDVLMKEYSVTEMELVRRIRSICQKPLSEVFEPTDSEIQDYLIRANSAEEFKELLGADTHYMQGFYDRRLGVSNFKTAKANCLYKMKVPGISPCTADNEALVFSQIIGDGSYDSVRGALRIQHGINQLEYLRWKVSILQNAYPNLAGVNNIKVRIHSQGHEYADWYSGRLPKHLTDKIESYAFFDFVSNLTPLAMLWLYLDDGCLYWKDTKCINICSGVDLSKHEIMRDFLSTYNIHSVAYDNACTIAQKVEIVKFLNTFVKPYINIIPQSMRYKAEIMI